MKKCPQIAAQHDILAICQLSNGGPPESSLSDMALSAPWAGATVATVMPPLLHCPIATPGSPRGKNQCSTAESNESAHAVAGMQTHYTL